MSNGQGVHGDRTRYARPVCCASANAETRGVSEHAMLAACCMRSHDVRAWVWGGDEAWSVARTRRMQVRLAAELVGAGRLTEESWLSRTTCHSACAVWVQHTSDSSGVRFACKRPLSVSGQWCIISVHHRARQRSTRMGLW